jgi:hypothetical protein
MPVAARRNREATAAPPTWVGWYRLAAKGAQWQPLVSALSFGDAWRELLNEVGEFRSGEWIVLEHGTRP